MNPPIYRAWEIVKDFEDRFKIDLDIHKIQFHKDTSSAYFYAKSRTISLPESAKGANLKEFLYHEIGHALEFQRSFPNQEMGDFFFTSPRMETRQARLLLDKKVKTPKGFVSWYAMTDPFEDFCETLSAWASNGFQVSRQWEFGTFSFHLRYDHGIRKKVERIKSILAAQRKQAQALTRRSRSK